MDDNEQHALNHPISGPIVACDNAIEHYTKAYGQQVEETDKLRSKLAASLDMERVLDGMRAQWVKARNVLEHQARTENGV